MVDLLLINPSFVNPEKNTFRFDPVSFFGVTPPLGVAYVAAGALNAGYEVKIIDLEAERIPFSKLGEVVKTINPKIVGISIASSLFHIAIELSEIIKANVDVPVIAGGPHSLVDPESIVKVKTIDYCLRGEADNSIAPLLRFLIQKKGRIHDIESLTYAQNGTIVNNQASELISDLNTIPFLARHLLKQDLYYQPFIRGTSFTSIITSRGCPFNCIFCFPMYKKTRKRSVDNIISEIKETIEKYGIIDFEFFDETFNLNPDWVVDFCNELIKQNIHIRWRARCRPELLNKESVECMEKAGCRIISLGVECASNHTLRWLNKKYTVEHVLNALDIISRTKIEVHGYFILGAPVETRSDMLKTIRLALRPEFSFASFTILFPIPGTVLYDLAVEEGYIAPHNEFDYSDQIGGCQSLLRHPTMSRQEIEKLFKYAYLRFYLRPGHLIKNIIRILKNVNMYYKILLRMIKSSSF